MRISRGSLTSGSFGETQSTGIDIGVLQPISIKGTFPVAKRNTDNKTTLVWGQIKYRDIFQRCQIEQFRLQYTGQIVPNHLLPLESIADTSSDPDLPCQEGIYKKAKTP